MDKNTAGLSMLFTPPLYWLLVLTLATLEGEETSKMFLITIGIIIYISVAVSLLNKGQK